MIILVLGMIQTAQSTACVLHEKINSVPGKLNLKMQQISNRDASYTNIDISNDKLVDGDPRQAIVDPKFVAIYPQVQSITRVVLKSTGAALTGTLVSKCHVLVNMHFLKTKPSDASIIGSGNYKNILNLSDEQLSKSSAAKVDMGFMPNGMQGFQSGYNVHTEGQIVMTGRIQNYTNFDYNIEATPTKEDWAIIRIGDTSKLSNLKPIEIASQSEIESSKKIVLMTGYPGQLIDKNKSERAYIQQCSIDPWESTFDHNCIVTGGNSSSPLTLVYSDNGKKILKISGIAKQGKYETSNDMTLGVPASAFRSAVEKVQKTNPCN